MEIGKDERVEVYVGMGYRGVWNFTNDDGTPKSMSAITSAKAIANNISEKFENEPSFEIGNVEIEPGGNVGQIKLTLSVEDTSKFKIPDHEKRPYTESDVYAKLILVDQDRVPFLEANIVPIKV